MKILEKAGRHEGMTTTTPITTNTTPISSLPSSMIKNTLQCNAMQYKYDTAEHAVTTTNHGILK